MNHVIHVCLVALFGWGSFAVGYCVGAIFAFDAGARSANKIARDDTPPMGRY